MGAKNSFPADYSVPAYTILAIDVVLTTAAVGGRTAPRRMMKTSPATDDYLCYFAFIANLGLFLSGLLLTAFGALDLQDVSQQSTKEQKFVINTTLSFAVLYIIAITLVKLSILFLYHRTFTLRQKWFRYCWWMLMTLTILWTLAGLILLVLQEIGTFPRYDFGRIAVPTTGIFNALSDILLMLLPVVMVSRLKMRRKQKIALVSIFCISGV
ncbi:integral membrane protein [Stagonosporopsis vannaccii]|nr:integral membrane protein [Stagonosporopsis vannaccii]